MLFRTLRHEKVALQANDNKRLAATSTIPCRCCGTKRLVVVLPCLRSVLLDLRFGLIGFLLLSLQRTIYVSIRRWRWNFPGRRAGIRSGWQTTLAGIVRKRLKSGINLFPELVLHFLQVVDIHH